MVQNSTHLGEREHYRMLSQKNLAKINTPRQAFSQSYDAEKSSLSYKNTDFMPQWVHLLTIHHAFFITAKVYLKSCMVDCVGPAVCYLRLPGDHFLLPASIKPAIICCVR